MKKQLPMKRWGVLLSSILMFLTLTTSYGFADLVGYWNFDENTGNFAYDTSGFNNTGTISGATWTTGKCGSGLSFSGNSYVVVQNSPSIDTGIWTVSCWVSFSRLDVVQVILDKRNGDHWRNYSFEYAPDETVPSGTLEDYLLALIGDQTPLPSTFDLGAYSPVKLSENTFYHMAATYNGSIINLYINGDLKASKKMDMTNITGTLALYIGATGGPSVGAFTYGIIDEVKIYNNMLTHEEILAEMQRCASAVSGCIKLNGVPAPAGVEVELKQKGKQTATTDTDGCYHFDNVVKGKSKDKPFDITIKGLVVE